MSHQDHEVDFNQERTISSHGGVLNGHKSKTSKITRHQRAQFYSHHPRMVGLFSTTI